MSARALRRVPATLLLAAVLAGAGSATAAGVGRAVAGTPPGFTFRVIPDSLQADEDGLWTLDVRLVNGSGHGIYGDSLQLVATPADQPPGGPGTVVMPLLIAAGVKDLSAGDSLTTRVSVRATTAHARLEVRFFARGFGHQAFVASGAAIADGGVLDARYPAVIARVGGRAVELVKADPPAGAANGSGVLLLPGEGSDARDLLVPANRLARLGTAVVIVGAPGRGGSVGPDDFAGPASRAAALAGLDTLLGMGVQPSRVGAWGISRGGTLALLLAMEKPGRFAAVAAQGACYDLAAAWRSASPAGRSAIEAAAGRDSTAWRARSPLARAGELRAAVLVQQGERDSIHPAVSAHAFATAVESAGGGIVTRFVPGAGHELPPVEPIRFLHSRLSPRD